MSDATTSPLMTHQNKEGLEALLPCPFCGGSKIYLRDYDPQNTWVECDDCQIGTLTTLGWPECVHAWNRRAPDATSQAQLKIYREALEPFAEWVDAMEANEFLSGSRFSHWSDDYHPVDTLPLSAFRRARTALSQNQEQSE